MAMFVLQAQRFFFLLLLCRSNERGQCIRRESKILPLGNLRIIEGIFSTSLFNGRLCILTFLNKNIYARRVRETQSTTWILKKSRSYF